MLDYIRYVFIPVCRKLATVEPNIYTPSAVILLAATVAQESFGGRMVHQQGGPAVSIFQFEQMRYDEVDNWLTGHDNLKFEMQVRDLRMINGPNGILQLHGNAYLATAYARLAYWVRPGALPAWDDKEGMWQYYKRNWNSEIGAARRDQFMENWNLYMPTTEQAATVMV
jgi:hypothetical protein